MNRNNRPQPQPIGIRRNGGWCCYVSEHVLHFAHSRTKRLMPRALCPRLGRPEPRPPKRQEAGPPSAQARERDRRYWRAPSLELICSSLDIRRGNSVYSDRKLSPLRRSTPPNATPKLEQLESIKQATVVAARASRRLVLYAGRLRRRWRRPWWRAGQRPGQARIRGQQRRNTRWPDAVAGQPQRMLAYIKNVCMHACIHACLVCLLTYH